jgi:hypothetical protein
MMNDRDEAEQGGRPPVSGGLCASCRHARVVVNDRGRRFILCERSRMDPRFARFPHVPVVSCVGFEEDIDETGTP